MKKIKKQRNPIRMKKKAIAFKIATVILVIILVPIWPVRALTLSAANSNSSVESTELLSVTAMVDGNEEAAAEAPADSVLSAAIEGKVPEGSLVSYQWQMAYELASKEASDITSTPPSSTEETSDVTSSSPSTTEAASDVTSSSPSTTEAANDITSSSPSISEEGGDTPSTPSASGERAGDVTSPPTCCLRNGG